MSEDKGFCLESLSCLGFVAFALYWCVLPEWSRSYKKVLLFFV